MGMEDDKKEEVVDIHQGHQKHNGFSFLFNMRWATTFWSEVYPTRVSSIVLQDFF